VPFQQLHADPAQAAIEQRGGRVLLSSPVRADDLDELLASGPVVLALPPHAAADFVPVDVEGLGASPIVNLHVHYDRTVLDVPLAAALGSPVQFVFDRTAQAGARDGQLLAVSLSHAVEEIEMSVASLRARYLPALERLLPSARSATVLDFAATHEPRATFRAAPGTRRLRPGPHTDREGLYLAGAWTDTGWPATMEGAVRSGLSAARAALATRDREQVAA
jgi:uncharacterized protein with NAD-binding domain and iron-sulfur cluster